MDIIRLRRHLDGPNSTRKFDVVFYIIIRDRTVSKCGGIYPKNLDLVRLRSNMGCSTYSRRPRSEKLEVGIIIKYRTVSKRSSSDERLHMDLLQLRSNMDVSNRTWQFGLELYIYIKYRTVSKRSG